MVNIVSAIEYIISGDKPILYNVKPVAAETVLLLLSIS